MSKLCFGSYAQCLKKFYGSTNEFLVNDLLGAIKNDLSIEKGKVSILFNCKTKVMDDIVSLSQTIKVVDNIETYFNEYIIPNMYAASKNDLVQLLQRLINGDDSISYETKCDLLSYKDNLAKFLSKVFLYAIVQNNIVENPLNNLGELETTKEPKFERTSLASDFNNVFIEVEQDKDLGLNNNNHIKTFHFNIENNAFTFDALGRYLQKNIGRYLYSRLQLDEFIKNEEQDTIALEAIKILKQKINSSDKLDNELGNIVIYLFLENILNAPKLYTSIECGDSVLDKAGVHLLTLNNENLSFQMIFSKSHITNNVRDSIDKVFVDLYALKKSQKHHSKFLETSILNQNFDDITSKKLKNVILPQKRDANISVNNAYGILLGYTIDVEQNVGNEDYPKHVKNQMIKDLQDNIAYIVNKINQIGLQNSSFYIYLIPFNDADNEKSIIIKELVGGE